MPRMRKSTDHSESVLSVKSVVDPLWFVGSARSQEYNAVDVSKHEWLSR